MKKKKSSVPVNISMAAAVIAKQKNIKTEADVTKSFANDHLCLKVLDLLT